MGENRSFILLFFEVLSLKRISAFSFAVFAALSLAPPPRAALAQEKPLTVEAIFANGDLVPKPPDQLFWSPDGKHLTYIDGGALMDMDPESDKVHVMASAAKMVPLLSSGGSEQDRDHRERYNIPGYQWSPDSKRLLFDADGKLWLYDLHSSTGVEVGFTGAESGDDPKFSPSGDYVSYIRDHGIWIASLRNPELPPFNLAPVPPAAAGKSETLLNGEVDWVYEEELDVRSNYFWSQDSKNIAYLQMNETNVPQYPLTDWIPGHAQVNWQRYPQPGDMNPLAHVGVVSARGGRTTWMYVPLDDGGYIPRFGWVDRKTVWVETVSRDHKHRALYFAGIDDGNPRQMLEIADDKFVDEDYDMTVADGNIVFTSWRDGHTHIFLYSYNENKPLGTDAKLERQLTHGDFDVSGVYLVDAGHKRVEYASNEGNPLEQQVWEVNFDGRSRQLSDGQGFHDASFSPGGNAFAETFSTRTAPPLARLCHVEEGRATALNCSVFWETHALDAYHLQAPEQFEVKAHDGTTLYVTLLMPSGAASPASVPLIVNPYGGPHDQAVLNEWRDNLLFDNVLAAHGFAVLRADNRGMGGRGRAFAQAAWHNFGPVQLEDQLTIVDAVLDQHPQLDPHRLGWWGWSWGGTFTIYAMTHSDRFRAGVAVAPVTDWGLYDSIYTERYLGLPMANEEGYRDFSVLNLAAQLKGRLLLAQGTGDDNVHLGNTVQFVQKLMEAAIPYDLAIYPRKTHSIAGADVRTNLYNKILAEFEMYLKPEAPAPATK